MTDETDPQVSIPVEVQTTRRLAVNERAILKLLNTAGIVVPEDAKFVWPSSIDSETAVIVTYNVTTTDSEIIKQPIRRATRTTKLNEE